MSIILHFMPTTDRDEPITHCNNKNEEEVEKNKILIGTGYSQYGQFCHRPKNIRAHICDTYIYILYISSLDILIT